MHTLTKQVAEGLGVLDVAPCRQEIDQRVSQVAQGHFRRPVLVLGIDGAYVPSRPDNARGRRPGQARYRARRARWKHEWREAKGFRFYLLEGDRIVHVLSSSLTPESLSRSRTYKFGAMVLSRADSVSSLLPQLRQLYTPNHRAILRRKPTAEYHLDSVCTAQALGITIPLTLLFLADEVIR
jgi:hypothetical protein